MYENEMGGVCSMHGGMRKAYEIVVGKPERKNSLRGCDHRQEGRVTRGLNCGVTVRGLL
jgi:hypothetical protein